MNCQQARPLISAAVDGEALDAAVDDHIERCVDCGEFRADLMTIRRSLRLEQVVPPPDIVGAVLPRVEAAEQQSTTRTRIGIVAAAAACLALGLLAVGERQRGADGGATDRAADQPILLAWSADPVPESFTDKIFDLANIRTATTADLGLAKLSETFDADGVRVTASGRRDGIVPVEVLGYDPQTYPSFVSALYREQLSRLGPDEVILSDRSAEIRGGLNPGDTVVFDNGRELTVAALVPETDIASAEMAVTESTANDLRQADDNFMLVEPDGDPERLRAELQQEWTALDEQSADALAVVEVTGLAYLRGEPGQTPHLVLKERFGEFTFVPYDTERSVPDSAWVEANVASRRIPPLGRMRCQADTLQSLERAFATITAEGLDDLVAAGGSHRCWEPLTNNSQIDQSHLWGIAVELEPTDGAVADDPRYQHLVAVMADAGFSWGGTAPENQPFRFEWSPIGPG